MMSTSPATIAISRFDGRSVQTEHYENLETMLAQLLMNSGEKIPFLVRDKLLPPAIKAWEDQIKQDNCSHRMVDGICKLCGMTTE